MHTTTESSKTKVKVLKERFASLSEEIEIANSQHRRSLSAVERLRLDRQIDELLKEMESTETKLNKLEASNQDLYRRDLRLKEDLPKIDFAEAMTDVEGILKQFDKKGGAVLFLLQNSHSMAGAYLTSRILECLGTRAKHCPVELSPDTGLDGRALLARLAGYFGFQAIPEGKQDAQAIVNRLCESLRGGSTVFVELRKWDEMLHQDQILSWFLEHFWVPLGQQLKAVSQNYRGVKVVAVIVTDEKLSAECLKLPCYCTPNDFDSQKVVELRLRDWTVEEIQEWLELYQGIEISHSETVAKQIHKKSRDGIPQLVVDALIKTYA